MRGVHKVDLSMEKKQSIFVFMHIMHIIFAYYANKIYDAECAYMQNIDTLI